MLDLLTKAKPSLFIARPWDVSFAEIYEPIKTKLLREWDVNDGPQIIKEDQDKANREMFIARNKQLYEQIVAGIKKSDVFIADVTNANSNVMMELGIAILLNKNVIIFTGQDRSRLPFDIQGFKAERYYNLEELEEKIQRELALYLSIKKQTFDHSFPENHTEVIDQKLTSHRSIIPIDLTKPIKNLKMRIEYKFLDQSNEEDWLGIHLRAAQSIQPSELIYIRANHSLEIVPLPTPPGHSPSLSEKKDFPSNILSDGFTRLELILDGSKLFAATSNRELFYEQIKIESFGGIYLQANAHHKEQSERDKLEILIRRFEVINIDTTSPL